MVNEKKKKRLGEILIEDGILSAGQLEEALEDQKTSGMLLGQVLITKGYISEENLISAVGKQLKIPYLPLEKYSINGDAAVWMDPQFCKDNSLVLIDGDEHYVSVAMTDPLNYAAIHEIHEKTGKKTMVYLSTLSEIMTAWESQFGKKAQKKDGGNEPG